MIETVVLNRLRARLLEERDRAVALVVEGKIDDLRRYGYSCGYIKAIDDVEIILQDITTELQEK